MHKSKLYDMAAKIAVDKLAPKPIHIAISMQGGGSLSSIELPVIKRVSGGDIGDYGSFIGGYTDADAGVGATVSDTFYGDTSTDDGTDIVSSAGLKLVPNKSWSRRNLPEKIKERLNPGRDFTNTDGRYYYADTTKELDRLREGGGAEFGLVKGKPEGFGMRNISEEEFMRGVHHTQEHFEKPFYRKEKGKRISPDYETENRIKAKLKKGHGDFLTPKEQEVLAVMRGRLGEDFSYFPTYQGQTFPSGVRSPIPIVPVPGVRSNLQETPALPGENIIGYRMFEGRIKEEIDVKASNQSNQITKQIADISNSMIMGEWPKEKGDMMIKQLQQNLKRVDSHRNQQLKELKDNIHAEKYGRPGSERAARLYENYVFESVPGLYPSEKAGTNYYRPKLASGGGISSLNDSININGQPHRLVWANPQEERVLKDMGGSGRKVLGKPAYFDEWSMGGAEAEQQMADVYADVEGAAAPAPVEYDYDTPSYQQLISPEAQAALPSATTYYQGKTTDTGIQGLRDQGFGPLTRDYGNIVLHSKDLKISKEAKEKAEREEQARIRNAIEVKYGTQQLNYPDQPFRDFQSMLEKYKDMYPALLKEYEGQGDIFGAVQKYTNKEAQALLMDAAGISEGEEVSKEQTEKAVNQVLSDELNSLKEGFDPELGITELTKSYQAPPFKPPTTLKGGLKELSKPIAMRVFDAFREGVPGLLGIWGTGKINGKGVTIYKDGKIVPFTSDTERYNIESGSLRGENVVPKKLKPRPVQVASAEEVVKKPSALETLLEARSEGSSLENELAKMEERVNRLYRTPEDPTRNIFSELA